MASSSKGAPQVSGFPYDMKPRQSKESLGCFCTEEIIPSVIHVGGLKYEYPGSISDGECDEYTD